MASAAENKAFERRLAGGLLLASAAITAALMVRHPTGADSDNTIRAVHGGILLAMIAMTAGFALFVQRANTALALAGFVPLVFGVLAGAAAGTINGFVVPALAEAEWARNRELLWAANQQLATLGVIAVGCGLTVWSIDLWRRGRPVLAAAALAAGAGPAGLLISGVTTMAFTGAIAAYLAHAAWSALLGAALWRDVDGAAEERTAGDAHRG